MSLFSIHATTYCMFWRENLLDIVCFSKGTYLLLINVNMITIRSLNSVDAKHITLTTLRVSAHYDALLRNRIFVHNRHLCGDDWWMIETSDWKFRDENTWPFYLQCLWLRSSPYRGYAAHLLHWPPERRSLNCANVAQIHFLAIPHFA